MNTEPDVKGVMHSEPQSIRTGTNSGKDSQTAESSAVAGAQHPATNTASQEVEAVSVSPAQPEGKTLQDVAAWCGWGNDMTDDEIYNAVVNREILLRHAQSLLETHKSFAKTAMEAVTERVKVLKSPSASRGEPWQPIETAPKDGGHVLLYFPEIGVWEVFWSTAIFEDGFWCVSDNKDEGRPLRGWVVQPTHWMPLPASPSAAVRNQPPHPRAVHSGKGK